MDLDFQTRGDYIAAHWLGFTDPHSGIHHYKAGLGTEPYLDDVEPMTSTGLKTCKYIAVLDFEIYLLYTINDSLFHYCINVI